MTLVTFLWREYYAKNIIVMKKQLICLFILCFFALDSSLDAFCNTYDLDEGGEVSVVIVLPKEESSMLNFSLPDEYLNEEGELLMPLNIRIEKGKETIYSTQSESLVISLSNLKYLEGNFILVISIGNFTFEKLVSSQAINLGC